MRRTPASGYRRWKACPRLRTGGASRRLRPSPREAADPRVDKLESTPMSSSHGLVKRHGQGDSLELELADLAHLKALGLNSTNEVLADEDAIRRGLRGDPRGDVHGAPEVVALVVDHRPGVHSHVGGRKTSWPDSVDDLQRRAHCVGRITEVEMDTVPEHLHHVSAVVAGDLVDQLREADCHARRLIVPGLLGEPRVAGEIGERCGLDSAW